MNVSHKDNKLLIDMDPIIVQLQEMLFEEIEKDTGDVLAFTHKYFSLESDVERVNFLHRHVKKYDLLKNQFKEDTKSNCSAKQHKTTGDVNFVKKQIIQALNGYTRAIMNAGNQELLAEGYANRSAALFKLGMFKECIEDINRALKHGYPKEKASALLERKKTATTTTTKNPRQHFFETPPKINKNQRYLPMPCASNSIELRLDKKNRQRVYAVKDIQVGQTVSVEEPVNFVLISAETYHCHDCFQICYNPIPCESCTQACYCCVKCRDAAWSKYHQYECPLLVTLKYIAFEDKFLLLAVKQALWQQNEDKALCDDDIMRKMVENVISKTEDEDIFLIILAAAVVFDLMKTHTKLFTENDDVQFEDRFKDTLVKYLLICSNYSGVIKEFYPSWRFEPMCSRFEVENVAYGLYPFSTLLNHSCAPNVCAFHHGTKLVVRAMRSIKKGEECVICYQTHYLMDSKEQRQRLIYEQYGFTCRCKACENDWVETREECHFLKKEENTRMWEKIANGDVGEAKRNVNKFVNQVQGLEHKEPNGNLTSLTNILVRCYHLLGNKREIY